MGMEFLETVGELGKHVQKEWRNVQFNESIFSSICLNGLINFKSRLKFVPQFITQWILSESFPMEIQRDHHFSQLPITLYRNEGFYIELLCWTMGTGTIHSHSFSGAFLMLSGQCMNTQYHFSVDREVNPLLQVGQLVSQRPELLRAGEIREIHSGDSFIHNTFHLTQPSFTLVIRTPRDQLSPPQKDYIGTQIALGISHQKRTMRQIQTIKMLKVSALFSPSIFENTLEETIKSLDFISLLVVLLEIFPILSPRHDSLVRRLLETSESLGQLLNALEEEKRRRLIVSMRMLIRDSDELLVLGAMTFITNKSDRWEFLRGTIGIDLERKVSDIRSRVELLNENSRYRDGLRCFDQALEQISL